MATARRKAMPAGSASGAAAAFAGLVAAAAGAAAFTGALYRYPPSLVAVGAAVATLGVLALALGRQDVAVTIGFLLLGIVISEPAPSDGIFVVVITVAAVTGRLAFQRVPLAVMAALGAFLLLNLVSAMDAVDTPGAVRYFMITAYLVGFSMWLAGYLDSARRVRAVMLAYLAAAVSSAVLGVLAVVAPIPGRKILLGGAEDRAKALFEDPNVFAPFLVVAALILFEEALEPRLLRARGRALLLLAPVTLGVLFAYSRAAWLNLAVGAAMMLLVLVVRRGGGRRVLTALAVLAASAVVGGAALEATGSVAFLGQRASLQTYDAERFGAQREGIRMAEEHPLGIGPGQSEALMPTVTHSSYVRALAEQGLAGLVAVLVFVVATLVLAVRNALLGSSTFAVGSAALLGAWCGLLANSFFVDTIHWRHLWVVAALVWVGAWRREMGGAGAA